VKPIIKVLFSLSGSSNLITIQTLKGAIMLKIFQTILLILLGLVLVTPSFSQEETTSNPEFLQPGTSTLGGTAELSWNTQDETDYSIFTFSPELSYFIARNISVGANLSFEKWTSKNDARTSTNSTVGFGPIINMYFASSLKGSMYTGVSFNWAEMTYGTEYEDDSWGGSDYSDSWDQKTLDIILGYAFMLNDHIAFTPEVYSQWNWSGPGLESVPVTWWGFRFGFRLFHY